MHHVAARHSNPLLELPEELYNVSVLGGDVLWQAYRNWRLQRPESWGYGSEANQKQRLKPYRQQTLHRRE